MDLVAVVTDQRYGTGQVMTFAIPIGTLAAVTFWGFFQRTNRRRPDEDEKLFTLEELRQHDGEHEHEHE